MIPRYQGPYAHRLFGDKHKFDVMMDVVKSYAVQQTPHDNLKEKIYALPVPSIFAVQDREASVGHDVVAFLQVVVESAPEDIRHLIHFGLTSSDLTEHHLHEAASLHAHHLSLTITDLRKAMFNLPHLPRASRTHGQRAEITSLQHQIQVKARVLHSLSTDLDDASNRMAVVKSPGAVGMGRWYPRSPVDVASTQVIPRDRLLMWASAYLRLAVALEDLALFVRAGARAEVGEFREGAAADRIGSSAMPHKRNPIDCEKVSGLARLARGYYLAIAETAGGLWEDRDISNSSVERVAVADLANVVEHMLTVMTNVMINLYIDTDKMIENAEHWQCWTSIAQTVCQSELRVSFTDAADLVRRASESLSSSRWGKLLFQALYSYVFAAHGHDKAVAVDEMLKSTWRRTFDSVTRT